MLWAMDIPAASAGPWIALGVVLGILLVALTGLATAGLLRRRGAPPPEGPAVDRRPADDLPGFLENPPGLGGPRRRAEGWVALSAPAVAVPTGTPPTGTPPTGTRPSGTARVLAAMGLVALLLVGAAAAVAVVDRGPVTSAPPAAPTGDRAGEPPARAEARLAFGGVVLERRAVGVTATYPRVVLEGSGAGARATVELPTFNCLTAEAPDDPLAAGCTPAGTEFAELTAPALQVTWDGRELRAAGRFATWVRPNGSSPTRTGRAYDLVITVDPVGDRSDGGWLPATGVLQLGTDRAGTVDGESEVRYPD
jgi:hypothetical protein